MGNIIHRFSTRNHKNFIGEHEIIINKLNVISLVQFCQKLGFFFLREEARLHSIDIGPDEMDLLEPPGPDQLVLLLRPGPRHHGVVSVDAEVCPVVSEPEVKLR